MSRIGNNPIAIPEGVTVSLEGNVIIVRGTIGELSQEIDTSINVTIADGIITFTRGSEET